MWGEKREGKGGLGRAYIPYVFVNLEFGGWFFSGVFVYFCGDFDNVFFA